MTFVDYLSLHGGAERLACLIAANLDQSRFDSTLCVSRWPLAASEQVHPAAVPALDALDRGGARLIGLGRQRKLGLAALWRLTRHLRRERIDVLHTHKFGSNAWGSLAGLAAQVPVVIAHEHTWSYTGQPLRRALDRHLIARTATRFVAVSSEDQRRMIEIERIPPDKTLYVPNGVITTPPTPGRDVRAELGIAPETAVIGIVAVLRPQKAHGILLRAAAMLVAEQLNVRIVVVGDGPESGPLQQCAKDLCIAGSVSFIGNRTDVPDVLSALDLAVCCSDFEGSPLAVMEYMAAGLPIVATAVGGVPDLITSEVDGLLVPPRDPAALAAALRRLLQDRELAAHLGEQAQVRQRAKFDFAVMVRRLEALYAELLEERQSDRLSRRRRHPITS